jgi:lipoprotein-anchoring transpeptidase ErfK/SrfK
MKALSIVSQTVASAFALLIVAGCASKPLPPPPAPEPVKKPTPPPVGWWKGEGVTGAPRIVVDLSDQRAFFYKGEEIVGESKVSSGKKGFRTPPGDYKVTQKDKNHKSNLYGKILNGEGRVVNGDADMSKQKVPEGHTFAGASMPFYLRFYRGYGLHAGKVPNYPASHGCVRLPRFMAEHFFNNSVIGMPVIVRE